MGLSLYASEGALVDEELYLKRYQQFEDFIDTKFPQHSHEINHVTTSTLSITLHS